VVGNNGIGALTINGGSVASLYLYLGANAGSSGTATISSGTCTLYFESYIGNSGTGTLLINGGAVIEINNSSCYLGYNAGSNGTALVTGGTWSNSGSLFVGNSGIGTLLVNGGAVSDSSGYLGYNAGSNGLALVTGGTWNNTGDLYIGNSGTGTLNLTGSGNVTVGSGAGILILAPSATSAGTLNIGVGGAAGALNAAIVTGGIGNATVNFNHTGSLTFAPSLTGTLTVNKLGAGTTILTASNTYTGTTTIASGTLQLGNGGTSGSLSGSSAITGSSGAILAFNRSNSITVPNNISGGIGLVQLGAGTVILSGSNTFAGTTTVMSSGAVLLSNQNALAGSTVASGGTGIVFAPLSGHAFSFGGLSGAGNLNLMDNGATPNAVALTVGGNNGSTTYSGVLSGSGSLSKTGIGTLILTGSNAHTGGTTITAGTMQLGDASTVNGSVSGNIIDNAALVFANPTAQSYSGSISGSGTLTKTGAGTLTLSGNTTVSSFSVNQGAVVLSNGIGGVTDNNGSIGGGAGSNGAVAVASGTWNNLGNLYVGSSGCGSLNLTGSGKISVGSGTGALTLALTGSSTGTLNLGGGGDAGMLNASVVTGGSGTATVNFNQSGAYVFAPALNGNLTVNMIGSGTTILAGSLQVSALNVNAGSTQLTESGSVGALTVANNGTLVLTPHTQSVCTVLSISSLAIAPSAITITTGTFVIGTRQDLGLGSVVDDATLLFRSGNTLTVSNSISGSGVLVQSGVGLLVLTGSNRYTGGTIITSGTLRVGSASALGALGNPLAAWGGTMDLGGFNATAGALSGSSGALITNASSGTNTLTSALTGGTSVYAGAIRNGAGCVVLTKQGTGTLILSGSLGFSGLNANGGDVEIMQSGSIGAVSVASGATVTLAAHSGSTYRVLDVSGLTLSGTVGTLDLRGNTLGDFNGDGSVNTTDCAWLDGSELDRSFVVLAGGQSRALPLQAPEGSGPAPVDATPFSSPDGVPEPRTLGLLLAGALSLLGFRRG